MDLEQIATRVIADTELKADHSTAELTIDQRDILDRAIDKLRIEVGAPALSEGRCIEIICFDFLQSFETPVPTREELTNGVGEA